MKEKLKNFLSQYIGRGELKKDRVTQEDVDMLLFAAHEDGIEQKIIDYGTLHPDAAFWDLLRLISTNETA